MQSIRITSRPPSRVKPIEPVQKIIYQSNTYRKDLSWLHFDDEPRAQERQQVKYFSPTYPQVPKVLHILFWSYYLTIPSNS